MIQFSSQGISRSAIRFGCISLIVLAIVVYFFFSWMYSWPWWVIAGLVGIAAVINWRAVYDTGKNFVSMLSHNPVGAIMVALIAVGAYPFFTIYLVLKALGMRRFEQLFAEFRDNRKPLEEEFTEFEEVDSKPLRPADPTPTPVEDIEPEEIRKPQPPAEKSQNPYDEYFG